VDGRPVDDVVPVAVRVWAERTVDPPKGDDSSDGEAKPKRARSTRKRRYPAEALVFDTETLNETSQQLMVGVWRFYRTDADSPQTGFTCTEEGLFYPDDLPDRDPDGWQELQTYTRSARADVAAGFDPELKLTPVSWWLEERLHRYGDEHRDRCAVVGFNLPFDLGALASYWAPARGDYRGGWSLGLWGTFDDIGKWSDRRYHRRILARSIDPRRTLFAWGSRTDADKPDFWQMRRFVDLRTLVFALTDRSHSLESACAAFGDRFVKANVDYGVINEPLLRYARADVAHTATLYRNCLAELARHAGVDLPPHALYSPAGVGAAYLRAMSVTPPLEQFADLDRRVYGWSMSAFFGGRAEARIVRTPVPVVVVDFTSMYPAQNALLDTWPLLTAQQLDVEDATDAVRRLVAATDLPERLFNPATWREQIGLTLVELDRPEGVILPVRAGYEPGAADYGIGVNPLHYDGQLWYALPDVLAAALLGDAPIIIRRALRLRPVGRQTDMTPVDLRGHRTVDPSTDANPFVAMIEERHRVKHSEDLPAEERERLDLFLKITANATAYGSLARFDRKDETKPVPVTVYGPGEDPFVDRTAHPEDPGPYCFPPVAASITAGARLMLALIEHSLGQAGGAYAFMDTDSIAIVATPDGGTVACPTASGDTVTAVSHEQVRTLLRRFDSLNPYGPDVVNDDVSLGRSPWKVEHHSLDRPIWCYAIASKRYALYEQTETGPQLVQIADTHEESGASDDGVAAESASDASFTDWSEHGLGMYLDPSNGQVRDDKGRRLWVRDAWQWVLTRALTGDDPPLPVWADRYAVTQFTVSSPTQAGWFRQPADGGPTPGKPRPFGFGLLGHVDNLAANLVNPFTGDTVRAYPAAGYDRSPGNWPGLDWYDRHSGQPITTANAEHLGENPRLLAETLMRGVVPMRTVGSILRTYSDRPEHKSLQPDGHSAQGRSSGQMCRRPLQSAPVLTTLTGKEGNHLLERVTGILTDPEDYRTRYGSLDVERWQRLVLPVLREIRAGTGSARLAEELSITDRQLRKWLAEVSVPHAGDTKNRQRVEKYVLDFAQARLAMLGRRVPAKPDACLYSYCHSRGLSQQQSATIVDPRSDT